MSAKKSASNNKAQTGKAAKAAKKPTSGSKKGTAKGNSKAAKATKSGKAATSQLAAANEQKPPILEPEIRLELVGVIIEVLAIALLIAVVAPGQAVVTLAVSTTLRLLFGLGAIALPLLLAAWGVSFFVRRSLSISRLRLGLGVLVIFIAGITLVAANTAGAAANPDIIFWASQLSGHGGYIGGGVAWALLSTVGYAITLVLSVGAVIAGAILVGFSLVSLVERIRNLLHPQTSDQDISYSAYDLGDGLARPQSGQRSGQRRQSGGLVTPTARLAGDVVSASQSRAWADFIGDLDDEAENYQDTDLYEDETADSLGVTRRRAGNSQPDDEADDGLLTDRPGPDQEPAATGAGQAKVASKSAKGRSGQSGGPEAAGAGASGAHGAPASGTSDAAAKQQFKLPSMSLLKVSRNRGASRAQEAELRAVAAELQDTLREFQVDAQVVGWTAGPTVTLYKLSLGEGVRVARITSLADDIALALAASSVRIFSPIPGTSLVGVEVPNAERSLVLLGDVLPNAPSGSLQVAIGKDVEGSSIVANLTGMPHLLIGGTTGSGKSVAINSMIMSMLMRATPQEVRMILIDPKMVELTRYNDIPHLYVPVVTDATKAAAALAWSVLEMERRLRLFMDAGVKNIASYNEQVREEREKAQAAFAKKAEAAAAKQAAAEAAAQAEIAKVAAEKVAAAVPVPSYAGNGPIDLADYDIDELLDVDENGPIELDEPMENGPIEPHGPMEVAEPGFIPIISEPEEDPLADLPEELPLIAIVIDELADLMIVAGKDVESSVTRLSQLARAAGLHLVIATQRPSTNVITGVIKANIVNRIAFNVGSGIDSRVILDSTGAEALLGNGDLLFSKPEYGKPVRIQGCFVSEAEINDVANFWRGQGQPDYHEEILATAVGGMSTYQTSLFDSAASDDPLVWEAADIVVTTQMGSTSTLQRRLKVGYARAGRIMDNLEQKGIVGPANGSKPREVIVSDVLELESIKALEYADY